MPELPEVEAVCQRLREDVVGERITAVHAYRCATKDVAKVAARRTIQAVDRRAKHILVRLSGGWTLHVHLRMSGNLFYIPDHRLHPASARVVIALGGGAGIVFEDPRALARMRVVRSTEIDAEMAKLGPEPLSPAFTPEVFLDAARASQQPAKLFLMDQRRVAGLGNIYAAEALFRARIDPKKPVHRLSPSRLRRLHAEVVAVLSEAVESARRAYSRPGEFQEAEEFPTAVYGREGEACENCGKAVRRIAQGGRSTYYCPRCQR